MSYSEGDDITEPKTEYADVPEDIKILTGTVETITMKIKQRERIVRNMPPTPTGYNHDIALAEQKVTFTLKVAELEKLSLLRIIQTTTPRPPPLAAPANPPPLQADSRSLPNLPHLLPHY